MSYHHINLNQLTNIESNYYLFKSSKTFYFLYFNFPKIIVMHAPPTKAIICAIR